MPMVCSSMGRLLRKPLVTKGKETLHEAPRRSIIHANKTFRSKFLYHPLQGVASDGSQTLDKVWFHGVTVRKQGLAKPDDPRFHGGSDAHVGDEQSRPYIASLDPCIIMPVLFDAIEYPSRTPDDETYRGVVTSTRRSNSFSPTMNPNTATTVHAIPNLQLR